jgi:Xaa-Pro aminopeptidase
MVREPGAGSPADRRAGVNAGPSSILVERPTIPVERYAQRLADAARAAADRGVSAVLIGVGADLRWTIGYAALPLERLTMLILPASGRPTLVVPRLEALPARAAPAVGGGLVDLVTWLETEDSIAIVARVVGRADRVAVSDRLWAMFLLRLQAALPVTSFGLASQVLRDLRIVKDADEVALLRMAANAADRVIAQMAAGPLVGRTERDVAREIRERLVAEGHDTAEFAIVGSGPNSASPHHEASDRVIRAGEPVLLDIGGPLGGYGSDITRVLWVTGGDAGLGPDDEYRRLYGALQDAQAEATASVRPGIPAERVDGVARGMIEAAGYGPNFIHRLGHGIGLEEHEEPYLVAGNAEPLERGMAFSVEPGIYLEGRYGARIEDIVVCGDAGPIVLNEAPRDLLVVDG